MKTKRERDAKPATVQTKRCFCGDGGKKPGRGYDLPDYTNVFPSPLLPDLCVPTTLIRFLFTRTRNLEIFKMVPKTQAHVYGVIQHYKSAVSPRNQISNTQGCALALYM